MVCNQYAIPYCAHSLNAPRPYIKYWPEDGSLEPKHVASYVLIDYIYNTDIYMCVCVCVMGRVAQSV